METWHFLIHVSQNKNKTSFVCVFFLSPSLQVLQIQMSGLPTFKFLYQILHRFPKLLSNDSADSTYPNYESLAPNQHVSRSREAQF